MSGFLKINRVVLMCLLDLPQEIPVDSLVPTESPSVDEEDWDMPLPSLSDILEMGRQEGAGLHDALQPGEADMLGRL